jgi:hypothetical protein
VLPFTRTKQGGPYGVEQKVVQSVSYIYCKHLRLLLLISKAGRRRKIRCIRIPEDRQPCRGCEERGLTCIAQTYSKSQPLRAQRLPSRYRISQLESKVANLNKIVGGIQSKLGLQLSGTPEIIGCTPNVDDSSDDSSVVGVPSTEQPSHLRSLFQNDWLSVDNRRQTEALQDPGTKASAHLLVVAKQELQKLIPPKDEFLRLAMSSSSSTWLVVLGDLLPQPFTVKSQHEFLESYNDMNKPDVDAMTLATWLLTVAITAQQEQKSSVFSRAVSAALESTILVHDRLVGTLQGLGIAVHFVRL